MIRKMQFFTILFFFSIFSLSYFENTGKASASPQKASSNICGSQHTTNYDIALFCDSGLVSVTLHLPGGKPANSIISVPSLKVDKKVDVMPQRALSFTPIAVSPKWVTTSLGHYVLSYGSYPIDAHHKFENIAVYIQARLIYQKTISVVNDPSEGPNNYIFADTDSPNDLRYATDIPNDYYFRESPAWNLPSSMGGFGLGQDTHPNSYFSDVASANDMIAWVGSMVQCQSTNGSKILPYCLQPILDLSGFTSTDSAMGTLQHYVFHTEGTPINLRNPMFVYSYPGVSSLKGSYTDPASGDPAFGFTFSTDWFFKATVVGDKWEEQERSETVCAGTDKYDPDGDPCWPNGKPEYRYYYKTHKTFWVWVNLGRDVIPGLSDFYLLLSPWNYENIFVDGKPQTAVTIPVYQALPALQ